MRLARVVATLSVLVALVGCSDGRDVVSRSSSPRPSVTQGSTGNDDTTSDTTGSEAADDPPPSTDPSVTTSTVRRPTTTSPSTSSTASTAPTATTAAGSTAPSPGPRVEGTAGNYGALSSALAAARARWNANKPAKGYVWRFRVVCFCPPVEQEVTVDGNGKVEAGGNEGMQTVADAFAEIEAAIDEGYASVSAAFDTDLGYPVSYYRNRSAQIADEEDGVDVVSFRAR